MADIHVKTLGGEMLDAIVFAHYGARPGALEAVLKANPLLAGPGPSLPGGRSIILPALPPLQAETGIKLWD